MKNRKRQATAVVKIHGMGEPGRAERLKASTGGLDGIFLVDVNYILDNVTIAYDPDKLTLAQIKRRVDPRPSTRD